MIGERLQRALRHRVDGERRRERLDVQDVGRLRVLGAGAREQQPLRPRAGIHRALPARRRDEVAIRLVRALRDGDAEPVDERRGHLAGDRDVPAADEERRDRRHVGLQAGGDAPLDAAQVGLGRGDDSARARRAASR